MNYNYLMLILSIILIFISCNPNKNVSIETPTDYSFIRNNESSVSFSGQTTRMLMAEELIYLLGKLERDEIIAKEMFANEKTDGSDANPFESVELNEATKSIRSKVAASKDIFSSNTVESTEIKTKLESFISNQYTIVKPFEYELAEEGKAGQLADGSNTRYVNSKGMENNQILAKSLIGCLVLDQIVSNYLSNAVLDEASNIDDNDNQVTEDDKSYTAMEHKWDEAYGYLFAQASDIEDPLSTLGEGSFLNKYLSRVENDDDFTGIASKIFDAFKLGRAAIVAGNYDVRDEQAEIIKKLLSEIIGIRAVYYLQQSKIDLASNNYGGAFHALSEGYGFIYSLRFTRDATGNNTLFNKNEVAEYIGILEKDNGFWSLTNEEIDAMSESIAAKFDFTVEEAAN